VMTPRAIAQARLRPLGAVKGHAIGASGAPTAAAAYRIGALRAGSIEHRDVPVFAAELDMLEDDRIAGVLGRDFLGRYRVEIDLRTGVMVLRDPASEAPLPDGTRIGFRDLDEGLIGLEVSLDGSPPVRAVLDLGAQASIVNRRAAELAGVTLAPATGATAMGVGGAAASLSPQRFERIQVGAAVVAGRTLYAGDLPVFASLGMADGPAMIFGLDLLAPGVIAIDYRRHLLVLPLQPRPAVSTSSRR
ncbi:MAG TPA: aspartyl protease family protein, partial [Kofleriaceae bacterium]|nr:aspartyl protease family protein [Kofleriaceae bacterium]